MNSTNNGFTLIELAIVIIVLSVVTMLGGMIIGTAFKKIMVGKQYIDAGWNARITLNRFSKSLRTATDLKRIRNTDIRFNNYNYNGDTTSNTNLASVQLNYQGAQDRTRIRSREYHTSLNLLGFKIPSFDYEWFDENNTEITSTSDTILPDIKCIQINLTVTDGDVSKPWTTVVCPRNLYIEQ